MIMRSLLVSNLLLMSLIAVTFNSAAQQTAHAPQIVKKCNDFEIDGKGSSAEWNKTEWQMHTRIQKSDLNHETKSKILYSPKGIYVLFSGGDQKITTKDYKDFEEIYDGDVFEVFFHPKPELPQYFEYEVNQLGRELTLTLSRSEGIPLHGRHGTMSIISNRSSKERLTLAGVKMKLVQRLNRGLRKYFFRTKYLH